MFKERTTQTTQGKQQSPIMRVTSDAGINPKTTLIQLEVLIHIAPNGRVETNRAGCKGKAGNSIFDGSND